MADTIYKGWRIRPGQRLGGYWLYPPEAGCPTKWVGTLKEAREYVDGYGSRTRTRR